VLGGNVLGLNVVNGLLQGVLGGILGGGGGLLGGLLGNTVTVDPITGTVNSIFALLNGIVPIPGVTDLLTPAYNIGILPLA